MRKRVIAAVLALVLVAGVGFIIRELLIRSGLERARQAYAVRRYTDARSELERLAGWAPERGEVGFLLGECELALGRSEAAEQAWRMVPLGSDFAAKAAVHSARIVLKRHEMAAAEDFLSKALEDPGAEGVEAIQTLGHLYKIQGRYAEARVLLVRSFARSADPVEVLRELWRLSFDPYPALSFTETLEKAGQAAKSDDRIWLGKANLAIRQGLLGQAKSWLDACRKRRAEDPSVARSLLEWALASEKPDMAAAELAKLKPSVWTWTKDDLANVEAWFARIRGDRAGERSALEKAAKSDLGPIRTLDRRAAMALADGKPDLARELRLKKTELDRSLSEYQRLLMGDDPKANADRLARLASTLGFRFETARWSEIAAGKAVNDPARAKVLASSYKDIIADSADASRTISALSKGVSEVAGGRRRGETSGSTTGLATDGSFVSPWFVDDAKKAGLDFVFENGRSDDRQLPETMSGGVALLDYDQDGWLDVYVVQGGPFPPRAVSNDQTRKGDRLFKNRGDGSFEDATDSAGLGGVHGYSHGAAVGDFDGDGDPDLFVTRWRAYALYQNQGDGTFQDATSNVGLSGDRDWPTSAAFADLDNDGDLDLYVCHYAKWDEADPKVCRGLKADNSPNYCLPISVQSVPDHLFRNDGGRFVDVTGESGIVDKNGRGLGVVAADLDEDGKVDLFVANDMSENYFFKNLGGFKFREEAGECGLSSNAAGGATFGHGSGLWRFRRRRPNRPRRDELLWRRDHALPQPGRRSVRRFLCRTRLAFRNTLFARLWSRVLRREQRRQARPDLGQRPCRRPLWRSALRDAGSTCSGNETFRL